MYHLLALEDHKVSGLAAAIQDLKRRVKTCSLCGNYDETDPCRICRDETREKNSICVVEEAKDIPTIEATHEFKGFYHILGGVISPLHGIGPGDLSIAALIERVKKNAVQEVIIATNPTVEGDTTGLYIGRLLKQQNVNVFRIALGLPVGGDLEYADKQTLSQALKGKIRL